MKRAWILIGLSGALLALSASAEEQEPTANPYLAQAKVFFQGMEFEKCLQRLERAGSWPQSRPPELTEIELYTGLCAYSLGRRDVALDHFRLALQMDPRATLPASISPRIRQEFEQLAPTPPPVPAAEPAASNPAPAPFATATSVEPTPAPPPSDAPRQVELTPPALPDAPSLSVSSKVKRGGHLLWPLSLGGGAVLAGGAGAFFGVLARTHQARVNDRNTFYDEAQSLRKTAHNEALLANACLATAGTLLVSAALTYWLFD